MSKKNVVIAGVLMAAILGAFAVALAAVKGDSQPEAAFGAVAVQTTATAVPTSPLSNRNAMALSNLGPNTIYCGWTSSVTTATGFPVPSGGGTFSVDITYNGVSAAPKLFCLAAGANQVSPNDTRYIEVK